MEVKFTTSMARTSMAACSSPVHRLFTLCVLSWSATEFTPQLLSHCRQIVIVIPGTLDWLTYTHIKSNQTHSLPTQQDDARSTDQSYADHLWQQEHTVLLHAQAMFSDTVACFGLEITVLTRPAGRYPTSLQTDIQHARTSYKEASRCTLCIPI